jgi:transposase
LDGGASEVKAEKGTGAGSVISLARLRAWFFPESDEVIGEIAAAGGRNQPGEKIENKIAGKPMPQPSQRETTMSTAPKQQQKKKGSDAQRSAPKRKARGSDCQQGGGNQRRSKLTITNADAAGIDVGAQVHYVAVPEGRAEVSVRSFGAYTAQLEELVQWLKDCAIKTVAMESTGVYWIALFQKLEEAGFEVLLVDARQAKHVPGRKSDVQDCQWLQQLHSYGLLRAAFRPEDSICRLRTLQRHRKNMVECAAMWIQHMQKALNEMNLHLHHVLSDISGQSGLAILDAILAGERDPRKLATLAHYRVQKSQAQIEAALTGDYRSELLFVLSQTLHNYRQMQQQIAQCDLSIEKQLAKMTDCTNPNQASEPTQQSQDSAGCKPPKRKPKDALELSLAGHLKRILGVDLTTIPGLNILAVLNLLSEIGTNMTKWRNEKAFVSWMGLSPNNKISGQRVLSSRTRKVVNRAATTLRLAAMLLGKTNTPLGSFYRRKRAQLGAPKAITATARKLGCLIYRLIKKGQDYQQPDLHTYELKYKDQILNSLRKRANSFGFDLVEVPKAA